MCATPWLAALCPFALGCWICVNWAGKARCAANWRPKLVPPKSTCQEHRIPRALFEHWSIHKWCVCWSFLCWTLATTTSLMRKLWQQVCDVSAGHEPPAIFLGNGTTSHDEPILKWSVYHCVSCICAPILDLSYLGSRKIARLKLSAPAKVAEHAHSLQGEGDDESACPAQREMNSSTRAPTVLESQNAWLFLVSGLEFATTGSW